MIIAERLKEARKKSGINQKSLAEMVGVYTKDISRWETGVRTPSAEYIIQPCKALDISADYLLGLKD